MPRPEQGASPRPGDGPRTSCSFDGRHHSRSLQGEGVGRCQGLCSQEKQARHGGYRVPRNGQTSRAAPPPVRKVRSVNMDVRSSVRTWGLPEVKVAGDRIGLTAEVGAGGTPLAGSARPGHGLATVVAAHGHHRRKVGESQADPPTRSSPRRRSGTLAPCRIAERKWARLFPSVTRAETRTVGGGVLPTRRGRYL